MRDYYNKSRGKCLHKQCLFGVANCQEFTVPDETKPSACNFCGHYARSHEFLKEQMESPTAIRQGNEVVASLIQSSTEERLASLNKDKPPLHKSLNEVEDQSSCDNYDQFHAALEKESFNNIISQPSVSSASATPSTSKETRFIPYEFSSFVVPLLRAEEKFPSCTEKKMKNQLLREIQVYLNTHNLINSSDPIENKQNYSVLGDQLIREFKNFYWNDTNSVKGHPCQSLISRLSNRRRQSKHYRKMASMSSESKSSEFLGELMESSCPTNFVSCEENAKWGTSDISRESNSDDMELEQWEEEDTLASENWNLVKESSSQVAARGIGNEQIFIKQEMDNTEFPQELTVKIDMNHERENESVNNIFNTSSSTTSEVHDFDDSLTQKLNVHKRTATLERKLKLLSKKLSSNVNECSKNRKLLLKFRKETNGKFEILLTAFKEEAAKDRALMKDMMQAMLQANYGPSSNFRSNQKEDKEMASFSNENSKGGVKNHFSGNEKLEESQANQSNCDERVSINVETPELDKI